MYAKSSVHCCKILKFWLQGFEIWGVKHGPSHHKCRISSDPSSLTFCGGGTFSRRQTIFGCLVDISADYRLLLNVWNISIDGRDMGSQTWSIARQFQLFWLFRYFDVENDWLPSNRFLLFSARLMNAKSSVDCCKILKFCLQGSEIIAPKNWSFGKSSIPANFDRTFLKIVNGDFLQIFRIPRGRTYLPTGRNWGDSDEWNLRNLGPNMDKSEIFKPPYLPQMGADSPHSKTVFLRAPRAIMITCQSGGRAPPRGQTRKLGVGRKTSNPNFSNLISGILIKLAEQLEDHVYLHLRR